MGSRSVVDCSRNRLAQFLPLYAKLRPDRNVPAPPKDPDRSNMEPKTHEDDPKPCLGVTNHSILKFLLGSVLERSGQE